MAVLQPVKSDPRINCMGWGGAEPLCFPVCFRFVCIISKGFAATNLNVLWINLSRIMYNLSVCGCTDFIDKGQQENYYFPVCQLTVKY